MARYGLTALATTLSVVPEPALAGDLSISQVVSAWFDLNHQEFAVLTTALALVGFSVVAAILLMHTRVKATRTEVRLRADIAELQVQADRLRALLFAEPQVLISWAAGDNRPQISGDTALLISHDAQQNSPQRILAFGTWLPPEPALQMDHAVDALREAGEGFLLNLSTSNGRAIEAMGRAIGGQAIVRIRELGGLRRELAESNLRYKTLQEETELLRDFAAAAPWPIWAKSAEGNLRYANTAYVRATEGTGVADVIHRNLELLETDQRADMSRALNDNASFSARLPIVVGGERRIYDVQSLKLGSGSAGIAIDASEVTALRAALERMAEAHRRTLDQLSSGVAVFDARRRLAFYNESYRRLWGLDQAFLDGQPDDSSVLDRLARRAQAAGAAGLPRLESQAARGLSRGRIRDLHLVPARRPRGQRRHHAEPRRRRHLSVRQCHREPRSGAAVRRADTGAARDAQQSCRSGRGVRQQRPGRTVQSGLRQDLETLRETSCANSPTSRPWNPGAGRCSTTT